MQEHAFASRIARTLSTRVPNQTARRAPLPRLLHAVMLIPVNKHHVTLRKPALSANWLDHLQCMRVLPACLLCRVEGVHQCAPDCVATTAKLHVRSRPHDCAARGHENEHAADPKHCIISSHQPARRVVRAVKIPLTSPRVSAASLVYCY